LAKCTVLSVVVAIHSAFAGDDADSDGLLERAEL